VRIQPVFQRCIVQISLPEREEPAKHVHFWINRDIRGFGTKAIHERKCKPRSNINLPPGQCLFIVEAECTKIGHCPVELHIMSLIHGLKLEIQIEKPVANQRVEQNAS
jgi:hypothetical protein